MFDQGTGEAVLVIPGVQGRWEWMRPALRALSTYCRTISYSLCGDIGSGARMDWSLGFDAFVRQIDEVLGRTGTDRVALCGVSYGGMIATRYAAQRPDRVTALVLASTPGPAWTPTARQAGYVARPWLSLPAFCVSAVDRLGAEVYEALPDWPSRAGFVCRYMADVVRAPMIPDLMARRVRLQQQTDLAKDCAGITTPTLVITGEPRLDRIVPVDSTEQYVRLIPGARHQVMNRTGHLGLITQPERFARIVSDFVHGTDS